MRIHVPLAAILRVSLTQQPRQFIVLGAVACLLALSVFAVACNDLPTAPKEAEAAQDQVAQLVLDSKVDPQSMSDRELLLAVLGRLDDMEARMGSGGQATVTPFVMTRARIDRTKGAIPEATPPDEPNGNGPAGEGPPGQSPSPQQPWGVPQQLAEVRAQLADVQTELELAARRTDTVMVALGFSAPGSFDPGRTFQIGSQVCVEIGTEAAVKVDGSFGAKTDAKGGVGINFYGNKLVIEVLGEGDAVGSAEWNILKGGLKYTHCLNIARPEAQTLMAALPFDQSQFENRVNALASELSALRNGGLAELLKPNFTLLGEGMPAPGMLLSGATDLFQGIRSNICTKIMDDFEVVTELGLGDGDFFGFTSPMEKLQTKFNNRC